VLLGAGRGILLGRVLAVIPWLVLAVVPFSSQRPMAITLWIVAAAQFVYGLAMGIEDTNDISYRQAIAPDAIQGRMNATIRTVNRIVFFFGALLTGVLMTVLGYRWTLGLGAVAFAVAALVIVFSPLRAARHEDPAT
jgi:MFS family permease